MHLLWDPHFASVRYGARYETVSDRESPSHVVDHYVWSNSKVTCAKELLQSTNAKLNQLKELAQITVRFGGDPGIVDKLDRLTIRFRSEVGMSRNTLFEYRQEIRILANEIMKMRKDIFQDTLRTLPKDIRAQLHAFVIIQALRDKDLDYVDEKLEKIKVPLTALSEQEILLRIDPVVLESFALAGICETMTVDVRSKFQTLVRREKNPLDNERSIDEGRLESQVLVGKTFYNLNDRYIPMLERLIALLSEHGLKTVSRSLLNRRILESLFGHQLDLMCAFNIVQKVDRSQLTDSVRIGAHHYWIHDDGLRIIKEILKVKDAL